MYKIRKMKDSITNLFFKNILITITSSILVFCIFTSFGTVTFAQTATNTENPPRTIDCYNYGGQTLYLDGRNVKNSDMGLCIDRGTWPGATTSPQVTTYNCIYKPDTEQYVDVVTLAEVPRPQCASTEGAPGMPLGSGGGVLPSVVSNTNKVNVIQTDYQLLEPYGAKLDGQDKTSYQIQDSGMSTYIKDIARYMYILIAVIAGFYLVYGGIQYLTSDISSLKQEGKATIKRVIYGILFIFTIWTVFNAINPEFLKSGLNFKAYTLDGSSSTPPASQPQTNQPSAQQTGTCNSGAVTRGGEKPSCFDSYQQYISKASSDYGVNPNLIRTVIWLESNGNPTAVSSAGAKGIMQLLPATANSLGCQSGWDTQAAAGIDCGTKY